MHNFDHLLLIQPRMVRHLFHRFHSVELTDKNLSILLSISSHNNQCFDKIDHYKIILVFFSNSRPKNDFFEITNLKYPLSPHGAVMTSIGSNSGLVILGLRRARDGGTPGSIAQQIVVPFRKKFNEIDAFVASDLLFFGSGSFINQRESLVQPSEQSFRSTALCKAFYLVITHKPGLSHITLG